MDLGISLKMALAKRKMSNTNFAEQFPTSKQQVSNWITSGKIKQVNLERACEVLEMKVSEFVALGE